MYSKLLGLTFLTLFATLAVEVELVVGQGNETMVVEKYPLEDLIFYPRRMCVRCARYNIYKRYRSVCCTCEREQVVPCWTIPAWEYFDKSPCGQLLSYIYPKIWYNYLYELDVDLSSVARE